MIEIVLLSVVVPSLLMIMMLSVPMLFQGGLTPTLVHIHHHLALFGFGLFDQLFVLLSLIFQLLRPHIHQLIR